MLGQLSRDAFELRGIDAGRIGIDDPSYFVITPIGAPANLDRFREEAAIDLVVDGRFRAAGSPNYVRQFQQGTLHFIRPTVDVGGPSLLRLASCLPRKMNYFPNLGWLRDNCVCRKAGMTVPSD